MSKQNKLTTGMKRRTDLPQHPDDIKETKQKRFFKEEKFFECLKIKKPIKRKQNKEDDSPWVENKTLWKALQFVRSIINHETKPLPIELAIYKSAKYYKVSQH
jgi:hypothetical protein